MKSGMILSIFFVFMGVWLNPTAGYAGQERGNGGEDFVESNWFKAGFPEEYGYFDINFSVGDEVRVYGIDCLYARVLVKNTWQPNKGVVLKKDGSLLRFNECPEGVRTSQFSGMRGAQVVQ